MDIIRNNIKTTTTQMAIDAIVEKLSDPVPEIRAKAAEVLGKFKDINIVDKLISCLEIEKNTDVKLSIIETLGKIDNERIVTYLVNFLQDSDPTIRSSTATALGQIGLENAITALANACSDQDATVRLNAVEAIGKIGFRLIMVKTEITENPRVGGSNPPPGIKN
jgi:HEAT repeat protein